MKTESTGALPGFRLTRFEVLNWGTFHERVWSLAPNGENALLTGDIGSGKSSLVDAISTLLVPPRRLAYNLAAGAEKGERTLSTYVLGHYAHKRDEAVATTRAVHLRERGDYSVLLAQFTNAPAGKVVTLAQVFWFKEAVGGPATLFVVAESALDIRSHFSGFGTDIANLKKKLKALGAQLPESFPGYAASFRKHFGIEHEQALSLFQQTVSMKSVGDLTDFVRAHMLEAFDVQPRIDALIGHFDDLTRAHEAVLKAKTQVERLTPIVAMCDEHDRAVAARDALTATRRALRPWLAGLERDLLIAHLATLDDAAKRLAAMADELRARQGRQQEERDALRDDIRANGGEQLDQLRTRLRELGAQRDARQQKANRYAGIVRLLGLPEPIDLDGFHENERSSRALEGTWRQRQADVRNAQATAGTEFATVTKEARALADEVSALEAQPSNIPWSKLQLRTRLCAALGLEEDVLPFAGELLQVRDDEREWEGAIERVLKGFGTSMLVPDALYPTVAAWVNATHLGEQLVYFQVLDGQRALRQVPGADSLVEKVEIKAGTRFATWLERHLVEHFDYVCCESLDRFRREHRALTKMGQVRVGDRHVKDDRRRLDQRREYVLGWSNAEKLRALRAGLEEQRCEAARLAARLEALRVEGESLDERLGALKAFAEYPVFSDLDWRASANEIQTLEERRRALEASSDRLKTLQQRLTALDAEIVATDAAAKQTAQDQRSNEERVRAAQTRLERAAGEAAAAPPDENSSMRLTALRDESPKPIAITLDNVVAVERQLGDRLGDRITKLQSRLTDLASAAAARMSDYRRDFPVETQEVDARVEAAAEYRAMLERLRTDALPTFEQRFKELLNTNAINEIASFHMALRTERRTIQERVERINEALHGIEYNDGRYIKLELHLTQDAEVRQFQADLKACTEGVVAGVDDAAYSEAKFLEVKKLLERFRGRETSTDLDRRWTRKVTDVRNWFEFAASERWRDTDLEHERYSDSSGKSGGQKEKLAYTILAASLAYQFGIDENARRKPTFRFVVIDEAFGRGSDESARFGLRLFRELGLQLLIVTPLQKIHIIEPFVSSVGFVSNRDGKASMLRNITIEQYRAEVAARATS